MNTYFCKCGRIVRKSTDADNTGNRDTEGCTGCPYLLPWGKEVCVFGEGCHLDVKGYECRISKDLEYASRFSGKVDDKCSCYIASLDYEFLTKISNWIHETYPDGEVIGTFSLENIRPTDFSSNGRYRYPIYCAQNKKGMAAKAALFEKFFNQDGSRKDMTPEEEERKIKDLIENGKRAAQGAAPEQEQLSEAPVEQRDILAAENQIFVDPNGVKYRIGTTKQGKKTCWRTEHMENGEWLPNNVSFYEEFENAQGEFAAWIRTESLVPLKEETTLSPETHTVVEAPTAPAAANPSDTTEVLATVAEALPAFDYSGLDAETATRLQNLARRAMESKQRYYLDMMEIVYEAHLELVANCDKRTNQYSEATFRAWCANIGVSKDAAYRLLQVQALMDNSTPEEQEILEQAQPSLLYAAAKPSAPAEAVAAVKSGDVTTLKEYKDLMEQLKAEQAARKAAEERAMDIGRDMDNLISENDEILDKLHKTREQLEASERYARDEKNAMQQSLNQAISERDSARNMLKNTQKRAERMEIDHSATVSLLRAAKSELAELQSRPIEMAVAEPDPAEIERLATEKAEGIAAQRTAELQAQLDKLQQEAQENRAQDAEDLKMQDYDTVLFAISVIQNAWKSAGPSFRRLNDQCRAQLRRNLLERFAEIETEVRG